MRLRWCRWLRSFGRLAERRAQAPRAEALRQKIAALEQELEEIEAPTKRYSHVTQIGGPRSAERRDDLVVRLYDLSDLFAVAPPYNAERLEGLNTTRAPLFARPSVEQGRGMMGGMGGGMGGGGGGFFSVPDAVPNLSELPQRNLHQTAGSAANSANAWSSMDDLVHAITSTISPTSWDEVGGPGTIARLGNAPVDFVDAAEPRPDRVAAAVVPSAPGDLAHDIRPRLVAVARRIATRQAARRWRAARQRRNLGTVRRGRSRVVAEADGAARRTGPTG